MRRLNSALTALAAGIAGALWLLQAFAVRAPSPRAFVDQAIFVCVAAYGAIEVGRGIQARWCRLRVAPDHTHADTRWPDGTIVLAGTRRFLVGLAIILALVVAQTLSHVDERGAYLYMTYPGFPTGVSTSADGYVAWIDGHPAYAEAWQFAKLANVLGGAATDRDTGDHDARGAYSYLGALLTKGMGFVPAALLLNIAFWMGACLALWYLAAQLLGGDGRGYLAAMLTATGQGFVFMSSTPMSYVAGYAWGALVLALAMRWRLFCWRADWRRWVAWGVVCGVSGLFYFTHVVTLGVAWLFGAARTPFLGLIGAGAVGLMIPGLWFVVGSELIGLQFHETTANDLFGQVRVLVGVALSAPLYLPSVAGEHALRTLVGGFGAPLLVLAGLGIGVAAPRRRQWYVAVAACGLVPALILHMIPVTQRYGYLAYPAIYVAAVEGTDWLARAASRALGVGRNRVFAALAALLVCAQLFQANADLLGIYRFAIAFGGP